MCCCETCESTEMRYLFHKFTSFPSFPQTIEGSEDVETGDGSDAQANSNGLGAVQGAADRPGDLRVLSPRAGGGHTAAAVQQISERGRASCPSIIVFL